MDMTVNRLPAPTWNWLRVNEVNLRGVPVPAESQIEMETPDTISYSYYNNEEKNFPTGIPGGVGADLDALLASCNGGFHSWEIVSGRKESEPVRLRFCYEAGKPAQNRIDIHACENSEITVIMDFRGKVVMGSEEMTHQNRLEIPGDSNEIPGEEADGKGTDAVAALQNDFAAVQTKIRAERGAKVHLVQVQKLPADMMFLNDVGTSCGEGAQVETIQIVLGGGETYMGMRTELGAKASALESKIGYLLDKKESLDMNYLAYHTGAKTTSHMDVSGVLRGESRKLFRGTIDFRNGSVGAKGDEKEDVLLFSEGVVNRTIPLILCEEEDVEGNHGATIGRLDDALLFYLASRGIEEQEIYEMMARARIDAICSEISDEKTRELVQGYLA
ncbi:MAG: SufD family Fe-S cluster assembly protein [Clostridiales bacterium]|nr:SufD family Fe-S cluster assembly protein [Clostridiales bacterium]